jgi:predicted amidophosphoribosyltransferase
MRSDKKILERPRCKACGERLYKIQGPFRNYLWGKIPSHCPRCGAELSVNTKSRLQDHDETLYFIGLLIFCIFIVFCVVMILIFTS